MMRYNTWLGEGVPGIRNNACHSAIVGDAQQSIYRFRGADVEVFRNFDASVKARIAADPDAAVHVEMFVNFRSHDDILRFVAAVCGTAGPEAQPLLAGFRDLSAYSTRRDDYKAPALPRVTVELTTTIKTNRMVFLHARYLRIAL